MERLIFGFRSIVVPLISYVEVAVIQGVVLLIPPGIKERPVVARIIHLVLGLVWFLGGVFISFIVQCRGMPCDVPLNPQDVMLPFCFFCSFIMIAMYTEEAPGLMFLTGLTLYTVVTVLHGHAVTTQPHGSDVWLVALIMVGVDAAMICGWIMIDFFSPRHTSCLRNVFASVADSIALIPLVQKVRSFISAKLARQNGTTCLICTKNEVTVVFEPCSHAALCAKCKPAGDACIVCRGAITGRRRVIYAGFA